MSNFAEEAATRPRTIPGIALALGTLVSYVVARGLIGEADLFCRALFGTVHSAVSWVPWLGKKFDKGLDAVKTRLINYLGHAAGTLDKGISNSFHGLAQVFEELGNEVAWQAAALAALSWYVAKVIGGAAIGPKIKHNTQAISDTKAHLKKTQAQTHATARAVAHPKSGPIGAAIHDATKSVAADVADLRHWTIPRVGTLEREVGVTIPHTIAGLRARARAVEKRTATTWSRLKGLEKATVGIGAAALVIRALGRIGAGWIRCTNVRNVGKALCRTDARLLDALLIGGLTIVGSISIVEFATEMTKIEDDALRFLKAGFRELNGRDLLGPP